MISSQFIRPLILMFPLLTNIICVSIILGKIVLDHIQASAALTKTADRRNKKVLKIVDKMLFNYKSIGMIHTMFPNAGNHPK